MVFATLLIIYFLSFFLHLLFSRDLNLCYIYIYACRLPLYINYVYIQNASLTMNAHLCILMCLCAYWYSMSFIRWIWIHTIIFSHNFVKFALVYLPGDLLGITPVPSVDKPTYNVFYFPYRLLHRTWWWWNGIFFDKILTHSTLLVITAPSLWLDSAMGARLSDQKHDKTTISLTDAWSPMHTVADGILRRWTFRMTTGK